MSAPTREDFEAGVTRMIDAHPTDPSPQGRYNFVTSAMEEVGFTPYELRGMLAVAINRLRHGATEVAS